MKYRFLLLACLLPFPAKATLGTNGFEALKACVMQNDTATCHKVLTPASYDIADRFISYKLMPCLPTNFTYDSESQQNGFTIVKATMPAPDKRIHIIRLAFTGSQDAPKLDLPATFQTAWGDKWQDKLQMAESIYLMIKVQAGNNLTCDQLEGLVRKK